MIQEKNTNSIEILLVEDSPGDQRLTKEALKEGKINNNLYIVEDGEEALAFLKKQEPFTTVPKPDLILLDLNLPKMNGQEVLKIIKADETLKRIPVVILTTSQADEDILNAYNLNANCYITKPVDFDQFIHVVNKIQEFWFTIVKLPED